VRLNSLQIRNNYLYAYDANQQKVSVHSLYPLANKKTVLLVGNRSKYPALKKAFPEINNLYVRNNHTYLAGFMLNPISHKYKPWQNVEFKELFYLLNKTGNISTKKILDFNVTWTLVGIIFDNIKVFFRASNDSHF